MRKVVDLSRRDPLASKVSLAVDSGGSAVDVSYRNSGARTRAYRWRWLSSIIGAVMVKP